jgi:hypothetical protein
VAVNSVKLTSVSPAMSNQERQSLQPPKPLANAALEAPSGSTKRVSPFPRKLVPFKASTANHRFLGKRADSAHAGLTSATKTIPVANIRIAHPTPNPGHVTPLFKMRGGVDKAVFYEGETSLSSNSDLVC